MDEKLRRWLESRCRERPDGTWLVEAPVVSTEPAPAFVLPEGATKEAYVVRGMSLGRFRLVSEFVLTVLAVAAAVWFNAAVVLDRQDGAGLWLAAVGLILVLFALHFGWVKRGSGQLLAWLHRAGKKAPETKRVEEEQRARWRSEWRTALKRCRPGWMVIADAAVFCVLLASSILFSVAVRPRCRRALTAWWGAEVPLWPLPDGCFNIGTVMWFCLFAWFAAGRALADWDCWRWNRRRA